ncbi:hypothetical protein LJB84_03210 [Bacteroidales bacterium OttesenSCG-928-J19]|nr:hypothetical protein [Bacteroidales bacterium OttesenSCG-928-J19]
MSKEKYFQIKVTAKAPEGYKPRTTSLTGICVSNKANAQKVLEEKCIALYKKALTEANPGVEFKFTATTTKMNPQFVIVDNDEPTKSKKSKKEVETAVIIDQDTVESETTEKQE